MQRMLNRFRNDLSVAAPPRETDAAVNRTIAHLQTEAAKVAVQSVDVRNGRLEAGISRRDQGGHKLSTAYPFLPVSVYESRPKGLFF